MEDLLFTFSMKEKARGSTLHLLSLKEKARKYSSLSH